MDFLRCIQKVYVYLNILLTYVYTLSIYRFDEVYFLYSFLLFQITTTKGIHQVYTKSIPQVYTEYTQHSILHVHI